MECTVGLDIDTADVRDEGILGLLGEGEINGMSCGAEDIPNQPTGM